ncbi:hypothetical protein AM609_02665 [Actinomyces sp. oral taxon 414]|nr:hypothetical protein AM609_02665 [Actinomyces sp. oral taxon 414]
MTSSFMASRMARARGDEAAGAAPVAAMSSRVPAIDCPARRPRILRVTRPLAASHRRVKEASHRGWEAMSVPSRSHRTARRGPSRLSERSPAVMGAG